MTRGVIRVDGELEQCAIAGQIEFLFDAGAMGFDGPPFQTQPLADLPAAQALTD
jgi:hypothetical protein